MNTFTLTPLLACMEPEAEPALPLGEDNIYRQIMGDAYQALHPQMLRRFGFGPRHGVASVGTGVMDEIWHGNRWLKPFLSLGSRRHILPTIRGKDVPFRVENYAFLDPLGRDTVTWVRTFETQPASRFDAYMIAVPERQCIVDYLGTHQHLAVDLHCSVSNVGGMRIRSGAMRLYEKGLGVPVPLWLAGIAQVHEWYDDAADCYRIEVDVRNPVLGRVAGYRGRFQARLVRKDSVPTHVLPQRYEARL